MRELGCRSVHLGGGEPLLRPADLEAILAAAGRSGVFIEYVETNSSWFVDLPSAQSLLTRLRDQGLQTLLVSISPFHNEFVPFNKVKGVLQACLRTGIGIFPWVNSFVQDLSAFDGARTHSLETMARRFGPNYLQQILDRYWVHMGGRALDTYRPLQPLLSPRQILATSAGDCRRELADTSHFHIDLYGNYIPGLCSGLAIAVADLGRPLSARNYPLITLLSRAGVAGLMAMAQKDLDYTPARPGYLNKCDLCTEIRTFLRQKGVGLTELKPEAFYDEFIANQNERFS